MTSIEMTDTEWQQVLNIIALAPWRDANPLLMKIGDQLRRAQQDPGSASRPAAQNGSVGAGQE